MIREIVKDKNCIHRLRYRYILSQPVPPTILDIFKADPRTYRMQVTDLTHLIPQSKIIFSVTSMDHAVHVTGALGLDYVIITYSLDEEARSYKDRLEQHLEAL